MSTPFNKLLDALIRRLNPNWGHKIAYLIVGLGAMICSQAFNPWLEVLIRAIVASGTITEKQSNFEKGVFITVGILIIAGGVVMYIATSKAKKSALDIIHQSIEKNLIQETRKHPSLHYLKQHINQATLMDISPIKKENIEMALEQQWDGKIVIEQFVNNNNVQTITYYSLAHIPFVFLLGYQLSHKVAQVHFKEWNNDHWEEIVEYALSFPKLNLLPVFAEPNTMFDGDIAIKISVTTEVLDAHISHVPLSSPFVYHLKLDEPKRLIVKSKAQIEAYTEVFVKLLDDIRTKYPNRKGVHIFCAAQTSLCFSLGANISSRMHSNVWVHNYLDVSPVKYPWALKMYKKSSEVSSAIQMLEEGGH